MTRAARAVRPLLPFALALSCSAPALPAGLALAERLEREHRFADALGAYDAELGRCGADAARCGEAALGRARLLERLDRTAEARAAYLDVPRHDRHGRTPARALYRAAELAARAGEPDAAVALAWRVVTGYPDTAAARDAVRLLVVRERERGRAAALHTALGAAAAAPGRTAVGDSLLLWQGELALHDLGAPAAAVRSWDELAARYRRSPLRDDALWRAAQVARARGDAAGAIARLRAITAQRRVALFTGSYLSEWLDDALLLIGRIYRDDLKDPRHALAAFEDLRDHFASSTLRDDAQLEIARTHLGAGDRAAACAALARLTRDFPASRFNRAEGPAIAAAAGCR